MRINNSYKDLVGANLSCHLWNRISYNASRLCFMDLIDRLDRCLVECLGDRIWDDIDEWSLR